MDALIAMCEAASYIEVNPSLVGGDENCSRNAVNVAVGKKKELEKASVAVASMGVLANAAASLTQMPMHGLRPLQGLPMPTVAQIPSIMNSSFNTASPPGTMEKNAMNGMMSLTPVALCSVGQFNGNLKFSSPFYTTAGLPLGNNFGSGGGKQPSSSDAKLKKQKRQTNSMFSPDGKQRKNGLQHHIANQVLPTPTGKSFFVSPTSFALSGQVNSSGARKALCAPFEWDDQSPTSITMSIDTSLPPVKSLCTGRASGAKTPSPIASAEDAKPPVESFLEPSAKQKATRSPVRYSYNARLKRISEYVTQKRLKKSKMSVSNANMRIMKKKVEMELRDRYPTRAKLERAPENPFGLWMAGTNLNGRSGRKKFVAPMKVCDDCGWKSHCRCKSCKNPKCGKVFPVKPSVASAAKTKKKAKKKAAKKNKRKAPKSFPVGAKSKQLKSVP